VTDQLGNVNASEDVVLWREFQSSMAHNRRVLVVDDYREAGFDAHCAKPLTPEWLLRMLEFASEARPGTGEVWKTCGEA
jgi:hypothetical protein